MNRACPESAGVGAGKVARWGEAALQGIAHRRGKRGLSKVWSCRTEGGINHDHSIEMLPDAQHRVWVKTKEAMQGNGDSPTASAWRMKRLLFCPPIILL
ncbi:hypothetical protein [Anaeromassilibacillus sp. SJQ-1]|uniref:hypothetical protein n=1 Tax=Anaeromassilibacillus sp. SJQ-1 TaxID=3375419 RepID=UPI003989C279